MYDSTFYFRAKEQNANIYRVVKDNRKSRDTFDHIGVVVFQNGKIKLQDGQIITAEEEVEIADWLSDYKRRYQQQQKMQAEALILQMNATANWVQSNATDEDITDVFESLVMSMHDLRQTIVRRYAKAIENASANILKKK